MRVSLTYVESYDRFRYPLVPQTGLFDKSKQDGRRSINVASSLLKLNELCSLVAPVSVCGEAKGHFSSPFANANFQVSDTSAFVSVAWNCLSAAYRWSHESKVQMRDIVYVPRPSMKVMELSCIVGTPPNFFEFGGYERLQLTEACSCLPNLSRQSWSRDRKFHFQFSSSRGDVAAFSQKTANLQLLKEPFEYSLLANLASSPVLPNLPVFDFAKDQAIASLSITDSIPKYLDAVAGNVDNVDRRVIHEYVQSGMSVDAIRELSSDLMTLADSSY
jgi:hypothetical protein